MICSRAAAGTDLRDRLREVGILLVDCDLEGAISGCGGDWLASLFCQAPIFHQALREAAARWSHQAHPAPLQVFPGCWLSPTEKVDRRRRSGYAVAVIITSDFRESEQLPAMCQSARVDFELARRLLVVDEDDTLVSALLRGAFGGGAFLRTARE